MLTYSGKIYFFACHALLASLQRYDNYRTDRSISHWGKQYEGMTSWLIEEIVFPPQFESLQHEDDLELQELQEVLGNEMYGLFESRHQYQLQPTEYAEYCLWIEKLLEKFEGLMKHDALKGTAYQDHFTAAKHSFEKLMDAVRQSRAESQATLPTNIRSDLERSANSLADTWYVQVMKQVEAS